MDFGYSLVEQSQGSQVHARSVDLEDGGQGWEICAPVSGDERVLCNPALVPDLEGARYPLAKGRTTKH